MQAQHRHDDDNPPLHPLRPRTVIDSQDEAGKRNMQQLIQLRWIAVLGQVAAILCVHFLFDIALPLKAMSWILGALVAFNLASMLWWRAVPRISNTALFIALLADVASLTAQLYLSGGITNPFVLLYLLQAALGAVLLRAPANWLLVCIAGLCLIGLSIVPSPIRIPMHPDAGLDDPYVQGLLLCFLLVATLLVVFIARIHRNLRARDAHLAALRQRAVEEEHIVRMGLLASGAAHELGTPLSTLAVILGDWQHLPHFASDPELLQDVGEMQAQVLRCKAIVTNILMSAGDVRGDAPAQTSLHAFLDGLTTDWRESRTVPAFEYHNECSGNPVIISDSGLRQAVLNLLDNALEASPDRVELRSSCQGSRLVIEVNDHGGGFPAFMLENLGKPYQSSKGRPGGGMGLFLTMNVARTFGGRLDARNRPGGGASVTLTLPLSALRLEDEDSDDEE